jgi:hypothetical protein
VFFGRFVALLRILAGPLAGALRVPYPKFLLANASGGITWAAGTTFVLYYAGAAAERWLSGFSWVVLVLALICGAVTTWYLKRRSSRMLADGAGQADAKQPDGVVEPAEQTEPAEDREADRDREQLECGR